MYERMTDSEEREIWRQATSEFRREAALWKSAWCWMLAVAVLSNAGWAFAWWQFR